MKKEKELDNLTRDVLAAEAAGFGCHYGDYIAKFGHTGQPEPKKTDKREIVCVGCGTVFYVSDNHRRKYCSPGCRERSGIGKIWKAKNAGLLALRSRNKRVLCPNRKAERKMLMQKPWENSSGLPDPTAYAATKTISEEEQRVSDLVKALRYIISLSDFELINRMEFRNRRSGRVYR